MFYRCYYFKSTSNLTFFFWWLYAWHTHIYLYLTIYVSVCVCSAHSQVQIELLLYQINWIKCGDKINYFYTKKKKIEREIKFVDGDKIMLRICTCQKRTQNWYYSWDNKWFYQIAKAKIALMLCSYKKTIFLFCKN